jgi:excisionase family DNA binding protein
MTNDPFDEFTSAIAAAIAEKAAPALLAKLEERAAAVRADPLMTVAEGAVYLGVSKPILYRLIEQGYITAAKGMDVKRVRKSVLDAYGTTDPTNK